MVIPEGRQLDDVADVKTDAVTKGILSLISDASCVDLDGTRACVSADDLKRAAGTADLGALSVPGWATAEATAMGDDHRRLEGLIAPGSWNVNPSGSAEQILASLIGASAAQYEANGLLAAAETTGMSPYEILVVASLVQRESKPQDFSKVARVIFNRLAENRKLEFDSTVNYSLDRTEIEPDLVGDLRLVDSETGEAREISVSQYLLGQYRKALEEFCAGIGALCSRYGMGYVRAATDVPFDELVLRTLRAGGVLR
ncbi:MAG: YceG-like family protein [Alphaproteobacteria bacterium ADurb.BinA305]|nr:MAG: YceG-like family protein [Alphaproteobacteria bacterium ADurb.BinA305]